MKKLTFFALATGWSIAKCRFVYNGETSNEMWGYDTRDTSADLPPTPSPLLLLLLLGNHRWLSSRTAVCPRLLALPRHHLFRLFRDWAAGRIGSGAAAGETNERAACMFRGIGEIVWKEVRFSLQGRHFFCWRVGCACCSCNTREGLIHDVPV